eukprot:gb/GECG01001436.1/.p1 GENE.gb/GECG01001436.1/~~gb/GECG01001436.1/.p1  ORF type:complete len:1000 (+),score=168.86 gb/GECG01001436.1/:1-3000(+)
MAEILQWGRRGKANRSMITCIGIHTIFPCIIQLLFLRCCYYTGERMEQDEDSFLFADFFQSKSNERNKLSAATKEEHEDNAADGYGENVEDDDILSGSKGKKNASPRHEESSAEEEIFGGPHHPDAAAGIDTDCFEAFRELTEEQLGERLPPEESNQAPDAEKNPVDSFSQQQEGGEFNTEENAPQEEVQAPLQGEDSYLEETQKDSYDAGSSTGTEYAPIAGHKMHAGPLLPKNMAVRERLPAAAVSPVMYQVNQQYVKENCASEMSQALFEYRRDNTLTQLQEQLVPCLSEKKKIKNYSFYFILPLRVDLSDSVILQSFKDAAERCLLSCVYSTANSCVLQQRVRIGKSQLNAYSQRLARQIYSFSSSSDGKQYFPSIEASSDDPLNSPSSSQWGHTEYVNTLSLSIGMSKANDRICILYACQFPLPQTKNPEKFGNLVDKTAGFSSKHDELEEVFNRSSTEGALMTPSTSQNAPSILPWMFLRFALKTCLSDGEKVCVEEMEKAIPKRYAAANTCDWIARSTFKSEHIRDELVELTVNFVNGLRCEQANPLVEGHWEDLISSCEHAHEQSISFSDTHIARIDKISGDAMRSLYRSIYNQKYQEIGETAMWLESVAKCHQQKFMQIAHALKETFEVNHLEFVIPSTKVKIDDIELEYTAPGEEATEYFFSEVSSERLEQLDESTLEGLNNTQRQLKLIHEEAFQIFRQFGEAMDEAEATINAEVDAEMKARLQRKRKQVARRQLKSFLNGREMIEQLIKKTTGASRTLHNVEPANILDSTFGLKNETVLVGIPAYSGGRPGKLILTQHYACFYSKIFGFSNKALSIRWTDVLKVTKGEESVFSHAPLTFRWLDTRDSSGEKPHPEDPLFDSLDPQTRLNLLEDDSSWSVKSLTVTSSELSTEILQTTVLFLRQLQVSPDSKHFSVDIVNNNIVEEEEENRSFEERQYPESSRSRVHGASAVETHSDPELEDLFNVPQEHSAMEDGQYLSNMDDLLEV